MSLGFRQRVQIIFVHQCFRPVSSAWTLHREYFTFGIINQMPEFRFVAGPFFPAGDNRGSSNLADSGIVYCEHRQEITEVGKLEIFNYQIGCAAKPGNISNPLMRFNY